MVNYRGLSYRFAGGVWYETIGPAYVVVAPPIGVVVPTLPAFAVSLERNGKKYLYTNDVFYKARPDRGGYEVVNNPQDEAPRITVSRTLHPGRGTSHALRWIAACAPRVAAVTMAAIVQQESGGYPWTLHDNTARRSYTPPTYAAAVRLASALIRRGHSVDLGLGQIDSGNLPALDMSVATVLVPCWNLGAAQEILLEDWVRARGNLRQALASYHGGRLQSGSGERYSAAIYRRAGVRVPAIPGGSLAPWIERHPDVRSWTAGPSGALAAPWSEHGGQ